jgi:cytochrome c nitrite reductase small subunit
MPGVFSRIGGAFTAVYRAIAPPPVWQLPVIFTVGVLLGLVGLVLHVSRATSYLSDNPATCVNCHVMAPQYATWTHSRHRETATCNDCHVPHDNIFRHYYFKASDGLRHATFFTMRWEPQVIRIHAAGQRVVQENCIRCHGESIHTTRLAEVRGDDVDRESGLRCWDCHRETPHGAVNSLAAVPYEHIPIAPAVTPQWLRDLMDRAASEQRALQQP